MIFDKKNKIKLKLLFLYFEIIYRSTPSKCRSISQYFFKFVRAIKKVMEDIFFNYRLQINVQNM